MATNLLQNLPAGIIEHAAAYDVAQDALTDAWRQAHHAAQAVVEAGKRWGDPQPDDSHSAMAMKPGERESGGNWWRSSAKDVYASLGFGAGGMEITVGSPDGPDASAAPLAGLTLEDAYRFVRESARRLTGEGPRNEPSPAPDLPDHPVADGAAFDANANVLPALDGIYVDAARAIAAVSRATEASAEGGVLCWPHHFDIAGLFVLDRDEGGDMTKTIGVGVTPPDGLDDSGYWYVSPWSKAGVENAKPDDPPDGRWHDRGKDAPPMALLSVADIRNANDRGEAIRGFLAHSLVACNEMLKP
ncbi:MAG: hypothetical protein AAFX79_12925 [Planctomycetota bacterium]